MISKFMKGDAVTDLSVIRFPVFAFPKIDGFRSLLTAQCALTSSLTFFPNKHFTAATADLLNDSPNLDGEVTVGKKRGKGVLSRTNSGLTSQEGEPDWHLWVFDCPGKGEYMKRYQLAGDVVAALSHPRIHLLKGKIIYTLKQLKRYIKKCLRKGYEGVITRDPEGLYKEGKSTINQQGMLKIKPFKDFEARIKGYYEEYKNTNEAKRNATGKLKRSSAKEGKVGKGTLGGFIGVVLDSKGKETSTEVRVGGGFTKKQRTDFWARRDELVEAGAIMKCSEQLVGKKDKPRHPNFLELRPEWDITG